MPESTWLHGGLSPPQPLINSAHADSGYTDTEFGVDLPWRSPSALVQHNMPSKLCLTTVKHVRISVEISSIHHDGGSRRPPSNDS